MFINTMQHRSKPSWQSVQPSFRYISQPVGGGKMTAPATMATGGGAMQNGNALPSLAAIKRTKNGRRFTIEAVCMWCNSLCCHDALVDYSPKRTRSQSWDPNTVLQNKRRVRPLTQAGRGHQRAQTMSVQQRKDREDFRKALVNLIM